MYLFFARDAHFRSAASEAKALRLAAQNFKAGDLKAPCVCHV